MANSLFPKAWYYTTVKSGSFGTASHADKGEWFFASCAMEEDVENNRNTQESITLGLMDNAAIPSWLLGSPGISRISSCPKLATSLDGLETKPCAGDHGTGREMA